MRILTQTLTLQMCDVTKCCCYVNAMRSCWIIVLKMINTTKCIISPAVNSHVVCWCPSQRLWADSKYNPSCGLHRSEPAHIQPLIIQTRPTAPRTVCSEISSGSPALSSSLALLSAVKPFHFEGHESWAASFRATDCDLPVLVQSAGGDLQHPAEPLVCPSCQKVLQDSPHCLIQPHISTNSKIQH